MTLFPTRPRPHIARVRREESSFVTDNRNMILAVVLSALVILGWTFVADRFLPKAPATQAAATQPAVPGLATQPANPVAVAADGVVVPAVGGAGQLRDRAVVLAETPRIVIATPRLSGSINLKGARVDDLVLKGYKETIQPGSPDVRLFAPSGAQAAYFAQFGWSGTDAPPADAVWTASGQRLTPATPVTLSYTAPTGTVFEIALAVDGRLSVHRDPACAQRRCGADHRATMGTRQPCRRRYRD